MSVESPKAAALVSIRYVVMSVLNRLGDYSMKQYMRILQMAIEGFNEELALYHTDCGIEVVYLEMSDAKTVPLPCDFVDYLRIGIPINGKLRVISKHDKLLFPRTFFGSNYGSCIGGAFSVLPGSGDSVGHTDSGDTDSDNSSGLPNALFFSDHYRNGQFVGGLYGLPGGIDTAYYRIDYENRQIIFSGNIPRSEIVVEYLSNGLKIDGSSLIPRQTVAPLRTYVLLAMVENDPRVSQNEKERRKRSHEEAIAALVDFQTIFTKDEYLQMVWGNHRQSPKR